MIASGGGILAIRAVDLRAMILIQALFTDQGIYRKPKYVDNRNIKIYSRCIQDKLRDLYMGKADGRQRTKACDHNKLL
jgi:hypothetical protein